MLTYGLEISKQAIEPEIPPEIPPGLGMYGDVHRTAINIDITLL